MDARLPIFLIFTSFFCIREGKASYKYSFLPDGIDTFRSQNLELHNKFRRLHGVSELIYKDDLNKIAQDYADTLASQDSKKLVHSNNGYGENLMWSYGYKIDGYQSVQAWYDEVSLYNNYSKHQPDDTHSVGHFTQLVWRSTCFLGIGVSEAKSGRIYVVASYDPPGNVEKNYKYNVLPPGGQNKSSLNNFEYLVSEPVCHDEDNQTYSNKILQCHNILRKMHGVPQLTLDIKLNKVAQSYANFLAGLDKKILDINEFVRMRALIIPRALINGYTFCLFAYSDGRSYGNNILGNLDENLRIETLGQDFTQMIWKSTRTIGLGIVRRNNGQLYITVAYSPPGNIRGYFKENVFPQKEDYIPQESDVQKSNPSTIPSVEENVVDNYYIENIEKYNVPTRAPDTFNSKASFIRPINLLPAIYILIFTVLYLIS